MKGCRVYVSEENVEVSNRVLAHGSRFEAVKTVVKVSAMNCGDAEAQGEQTFTVRPRLLCICNAHEISFQFDCRDKSALKSVFTTSY
jgi:hypothetical protein